MTLIKEDGTCHWPSCSCVTKCRIDETDIDEAARDAIYEKVEAELAKPLEDTQDTPITDIKLRVTEDFRKP